MGVCVGGVEAIQPRVCVGVVWVWCGCGVGVWSRRLPVPEPCSLVLPPAACLRCAGMNSSTAASLAMSMFSACQVIPSTDGRDTVEQPCLLVEPYQDMPQVYSLVYFQDRGHILVLACVGHMGHGMCRYHCVIWAMACVGTTVSYGPWFIPALVQSCSLQEGKCPPPCLQLYLPSTR